MSDARTDDVLLGISAHDRLMDRRSEVLPLAYTITENEVLLYHCYWRLSADEVIAEAIDGWSPGEVDWAIWHGTRLVAVIHWVGGEPRVVRLDRPALTLIGA